MLDHSKVDAHRLQEQQDSIVIDDGFSQMLGPALVRGYAWPAKPQDNPAM